MNRSDSGCYRILKRESAVYQSSQRKPVPDLPNYALTQSINQSMSPFNMLCLMLSDVDRKSRTIGSLSIQFRRGHIKPKVKPWMAGDGCGY